MKEFNIIKKYLRPLSKDNYGAMNLTDDVYFDLKKNIAISVDTYIENKHFLFSKNPKLYLKKIFRSSISDLYAKGIKPTKYFFSLSLPKGKFKKRNFLELKKILYSEQKKFKVFLSGGDLTISRTMSITFVFMGELQHKPIFRSGAKTLDDIYNNSKFIINDEVNFNEDDIKLIDDKAKKIISEFIKELSSISNINRENLEPVVNNLIKTNNTNFKGIGQPIRIALTGSKFGPGLYDIIIALGKEEVLKRLDKVIS